MELFDKDLAACISSQARQGRPMKEVDAKTICRCVISGLQHMHSHCFVHRDLKPANILVKSQPLAAVISDLGTAMPGEGSTEGVTTPVYRAPELLLGMGYKFASDIWSFGLICMELESSNALSQLLSRGDDCHDEGPQLQYFSRLVGKLSGKKHPGSWGLPAINPTLGTHKKKQNLASKPYVDPAILDLQIETGPNRAFGQRFQSASFTSFLSKLLQFRACYRIMAKDLLLESWLLPADWKK